MVESVLIVEPLENLEIDHIDPSTKSIALNKLWSIAKDRFLLELVKCQLLCKTCHLDKSAKEESVRHGEGKTSKRNCYCEKCAPLKRKRNQWQREYSSIR